MTVENAIKMYRHLVLQAENKALKPVSRKRMVKARDDMKNHILKSRKFRGNPILNELMLKKESAPEKGVQTPKKGGK